MITVLVMAAVTAVISAGFLFRSAQEAKLATRSFFQSVVLNLAEAGLEEGLYAINSNAFTSANGWTLVSGSTTDYKKTLTAGLDFNQATGAIYVRVDNALSTEPAVTAAGVITIPNQPLLIKQLRAGVTARRLWANSVVGRSNITFDGSASFDAYDSALGPYDPATNRSDQATVATNSTVLVSGSALVYGYVATGGSAPAVGGSGRIYGATSPSSPAVDPSRVRTDFSTNLTDVTAPATGSAYSLGTTWPSASITLPRTGDVPGANGRYLYTVTNLAVGGSDTLRIKGPVDIVATGNMTVGGSGQIEIGGSGSTNPSFNVYAPGTINIGGSGLVNGTVLPKNITIWGTKPAGGTKQSITIGGSGSYQGTVYAPNGNITVNGSGGVYGALIGNAVTISGSGEMHYDLQLGRILTEGGPTPGTNPVRLSSWSELDGSPSGGSEFARDNREPFSGLF